MNWPSKPLRDLIQTKKGFPFKSSWYQHEGRPIVKVSNFTGDSIDTSDLIMISEARSQDFVEWELHHGDVIVQTVGSWPSNLKSVVGKCICVPRDADGALLNQNAVKVIPLSNIDQRYLYYVLRSRSFSSHVIGNARGSANQASITLDVIRDFQIPYPPLDRQKVIAAALFTYDDLIENNRRRIQLLEQAARLLYKEWFVHLRFPGHEHVNIKNGVPEGWEKRPLTHFCNDIRKTENPQNLNPDMPYIGLEHMPRRSITLGDWGKAGDVESNKFRFATGDILFGKIRPYFHKVGFVFVDGIASSDAIVIRPNSAAIYHYTLFLLSSDEFIATASKTMREGSKMPRADWKYLQRSDFLFPQDQILRMFREFAEPICQQLRTLAMQNNELKRARDLLLPRLMSGEITV